MSQSAAETNRFALRDLAFIGLFSVLIAVCSWITIPGPVPFTLQTFGIFCALGMLGGKRGTCSILVYILLGIIGIPVFSGFTGGPAKLAGPTGGYLIGFIFIALIAGFFIDRFPKKYYLHFIGMVLGTAVCYLFGTIWLCYQLKLGFVAGLWAGVIPYLPGDAAKIIISLILGPVLRTAVSEFKNH